MEAIVSLLLTIHALVFDNDNWTNHF